MESALLRCAQNQPAQFHRPAVVRCLQRQNYQHSRTWTHFPVRHSQVVHPVAESTVFPVTRAVAVRRQSHLRPEHCGHRQMRGHRKARHCPHWCDQYSPLLAPRQRLQRHQQPRQEPRRPGIPRSSRAGAPEAFSFPGSGESTTVALINRAAESTPSSAKPVGALLLAPTPKAVTCTIAPHPCLTVVHTRGEREVLRSPSLGQVRFRATDCQGLLHRGLRH